MAPEQIQGKPRPASDQYALAVVAYEWLSGDRPFHGSFTEIAVQHAVATPQPLRERVPVSPAIEQVIMIGLAKEPKERFSSVQAFASALEQAFQKEQATTVSLQFPSAHVLSPPSLPLTVAPSIATTHPGTSPASVGKHLFSYRNHIAPVSSIAWSPDSARIVSGSSDRTVQIWEAQTGRTETVWNFHSSPVRTVAWTKNGTYIASAGEDTTVSIWETLTRRSVMTYQEHKKCVSALAWAPDSDHIASGGFDKTIHLWSAVTGRKVLTYQGHTRNMGAWVKAVAWSPNGRCIASGDYNGEVFVWDTVTGEYRLHLSASRSVNGLAWSPDSDRIAIACSSGRLLLVQSLAQESTSRHHMNQNEDIGLTSVVWSPDGKFIALGDERHQVHIWDPVSEKLLYTYQGHANRVLAVAWSPDGHQIASASADKTVQVWQAP
ncbi:WD40 repeat domain-containing serine/threonine-protein kinase [Ktedonosporobacter rubrisoli]|nr:WD40 repeat domain-containing serine/threonine-protein kinase [Ktedonosporobacter rubrisoli]